MIENIRKYTGLMIVVLVLLFVGLVFLGDGVGNSFGSKPVMTIDGQGISQKAFDRHRAVLNLPQAIPSTHFLPKQTRVLASHYLGDSVIDFPQLMAGSIVLQMSQYLQADPAAPDKFIANRLNVQNAGLEYGVTPSPEEVESFVENVLFADEEGNYDQEAYSEFVKERISSIGGTKAFNEYIRDLLTAQNLSKLLGGGLAPTKETITKLYDTQKQVISGQQISLSAATYEGKVEPTEEQLQEYYDEHQDKYQSDELRTVSYVLIEPDWEAVLAQTVKEKEEAERLSEEARKQQEEAKKAAEAAAAEANEEIDASEETTPPTETAPEKAEGAEGDPGKKGELAEAPDLETRVEEAAEAITQEIVEATEAPSESDPATPAVAETPAKEQLNGSEKEKAIKALIPDVDAFFQQLADDRENNFEKLAEEAGYTAVTTEAFSKSNPPEALSAFAQNSDVGKISDAMFSLPASGDPDELLSNPMQTADGWVIGRLVEVTEAQPLSFEDAKTQVTIDLRKKLGREMMIEAAQELREKLSNALVDGKPFEDTAKELEQTTSSLDQIGEGQSFSFGPGRSQKLPDPPAFQAAQFTNPGDISEIKYTPTEEEAEQAIIVFVTDREITKDEAYQTKFEENFEGLSEVTRLITFENWLNDRFAESDVQSPNLSELQ